MSPVKSKKDAPVSPVRIIKRNSPKIVGIFIDGVGLDRACKRLKKKIDFAALLKNVSLGVTPVVARYYNIIPYEDDSRQRSYLDAVEMAGFQVVLNRLPPKGIDKQVSIDPHITADMVAFGIKGKDSFPKESRVKLETRSILNNVKELEEDSEKALFPKIHTVVVVCPSKELNYPISLMNDLGVETTSFDFGVFSGGNVLKTAKKWVDLGDVNEIWRE